MNRNISEDLMFDLEMTDASTAATTSLKYDMQMYDRAGVAVGIRSTGFTTVTVDLMEATAATAAGSSNAAGRAGVVAGAQGGTGITTAGGVREMTITHGTSTSVTASTFVFQMGTVQRLFTYTTATALHNATAWGTTRLYFGSTVSVTADTGPQLSLDVLASALNSTLAFNGQFAFATDATNTLKLTVQDTAAGPIVVSGGAANILTITVQQAVIAFDLKADQLATAGERHIGIKTSTVGVACGISLAVIRKSGRYMPSGNFKGELST